MNRKRRDLQFLRRYYRPFAQAIALVSTAWSSVGMANMIGSDVQNFNPTTSGNDLVTVQTSQTFGGLGNYGLGLWFNWATNTLPYFDTDDQRSVDQSKTITTTVTGMDAVAGMGLTENWDIGLALPHVVAQSVKSDEPHGQFGTKGNTEIRLHTKYRLWHSQDSGVAVAGSTNFDRIQNNPYTGSSKAPTFNIELIGDTRISAITLAANLGYRFRKPGQEVNNAEGVAPILPIKSLVIGSLGLGYRISSKTELIAEVYGGKPANDIMTTSPRKSAAIEGLGGVRYNFKPDWALHSGIGTELAHSTSSPDLRIYAGITWMNKGEKRAEPIAESSPQTTTPAVIAASTPAPAALSMPNKDFPKPDEVIIIRDVLFDFDKSTLNHRGAKKNLKILTDALTGPKGLSKLVIEGHTDYMGSDSYNLALSRRRAAALKTWLVQENVVKAGQVITVGYGESRPVATNKTESGRELNRRVEFKIYHADNPSFAKK